MDWLKKNIWLVLGLGVVVYYVWRRKGGTATTGRTLDPVFSANIGAIVLSQDPGNGAQFDTDATNYHEVSEPGYAGWYRSSKDGSWFNPSTDDFYSAGSSPPRYLSYAELLAAGAAQTVDLGLDVANGNVKPTEDFDYNQGYNIP